MESKAMKHKTIHFFGVTFRFFSWMEIIAIFVEVFILKDYSFKTSNKSPVILDCGAHVGVSSFWFKRKFPNSKITSFEPNPDTFNLLEKNVMENKLKDVVLINAALSNRKSSMSFYSDDSRYQKKAWGDTLVEELFKGKRKQKVSKVKAVKLSTYIKEPVDFIKMDIEGSEVKVFEEIEEKLFMVGEIVFEFHSMSGDEKLSSPKYIISILEKNNFKHRIERKMKNNGRPLFIIRAVNNSFGTF